MRLFNSWFQLNYCDIDFMPGFATISKSTKKKNQILITVSLFNHEFTRIIYTVSDDFEEEKTKKKRVFKKGNQLS